jgi:hypothetical protein
MLKFLVLILLLVHVLSYSSFTTEKLTVNPDNYYTRIYSSLATRLVWNIKGDNVLYDVQIMNYTNYVNFTKSSVFKRLYHQKRATTMAYSLDIKLQSIVLIVQNVYSNSPIQVTLSSTEYFEVYDSTVNFMEFLKNLVKLSPGLALMVAAFFFFNILLCVFCIIRRNRPKDVSEDMVRLTKEEDEDLELENALKEDLATNTEI